MPINVINVCWTLSIAFVNCLVVFSNSRLASFAGFFTRDFSNTRRRILNTGHNLLANDMVMVTGNWCRSRFGVSAPTLGQCGKRWHMDISYLLIEGR